MYCIVLSSVYYIEICTMYYIEMQVRGRVMVEPAVLCTMYYMVEPAVLLRSVLCLYCTVPRQVGDSEAAGARA